MTAASPSETCAARLAVLADPTRLAILRVLLTGPRHVHEINGHVNVAQNLLSHHLRILRDTGLVESWRDGKAVMYAVAPGVDVNPAHDAIDLGCCSLTFHKRRP